MTKKAAKKAGKRAPKSTRMAVDWTGIQQAWDSGMSYLDMSKKFDPHFDEKRPDCTKPMRAKISMALTKGVRINGETVRFKPRAGMRKIGVGKKAPKPKKQKAAVA